MNEVRPFAFLPVPDRFVETPPEEGIKATIITPIYKEFDNGNIFRLIETFSNQNVPSDKFEVLCVVNNPRRDEQENTLAYKENQQTLALQKILGSESMEIPSSFSVYQRAVIEKALRIGLNMHFIDATHGGVEGNMGIARQAGVIEAVKRLRSVGQLERGIIAHFDADTVVSKDFIEKLLRTYQDASIDSLFLNYDYVLPHGTEELFKTTKQNELQFWCHRLHWLMKGKPIMATPQITATASSHVKVDGVPLRNTGEDIELANLLRRDTSFTMRPDVTVFASDRARMESFDGRGRYMSMQKVGKGVCPNPRKKVLENIFERFEYETTGDIPDFNFFVEQFEKSGITLKPSEEDIIKDCLSEGKNIYVSLKKILWEKERSGEFSPLTPLQYTSSVLEILGNFTSEAETQSLRSHIARETKMQKLRFAARKSVVFSYIKRVQSMGLGEVTAQNIHFQEFINQNPWVAEKINELRKNSNSFEDLKQAAINEFPDLLGTWDDELHGSIAKIKGVYTFIFEAQEKEAEFPGTTNLLKNY